MKLLEALKLLNVYTQQMDLMILNAIYNKLAKAGKEV